MGPTTGETFAPVAKMMTVWTVIALAITKGWHLHQMDVKNAFIQGELEEGGVHGSMTQLPIQHSSESHLPTQEASL